MEVGGTVEEDDGTEEVKIDEEKKKRCFLCLGMIKEPEEVMDCPHCDRTYHRTCAKRVRSCPVCGQAFGDNES